MRRSPSPRAPEHQAGASILVERHQLIRHSELNASRARISCVNPAPPRCRIN